MAGHSEDDDGPAAWMVVLSLMFGIAMCCICLVCLFFLISKNNGLDELRATAENSLRQCQSCCSNCMKSSSRAPRVRQKELDGHEWIFKPQDGRSIVTLSAPEFDAAETGETLEPGEKFEVSAEEGPPMVEQPVPVEGGVEIEELAGGEGQCTFLCLADGRGWVLDREPGLELCYKLFEPVDELWLYDPENGRPMAIRDSAFIDGEQTGQTLEPGEKFSVSEIQASEDTGTILFLKLKDGRGWVFDQKDEDGDILCKRMIDETWEYRPVNGAPIAIRTEPNIDSEKTEHKVYSEESFRVDLIVKGLDDELFLRLEDGRGWLFDKHPEHGTMCFRVF
ncbi:unnamed protein product [Prorocentrum cordatum]|uniref:DUF4178 domain-containing protein n=1 Tax=Prorocentrum cordatum TaxID=2364126 RepID=A0ABN9Y500_9DINO|nr:unnamed protein product [Polarella glacialis]